MGAGGWGKSGGCALGCGEGRWLENRLPKLGRDVVGCATQGQPVKSSDRFSAVCQGQRSAKKTPFPGNVICIESQSGKFDL